MFIGVICIYIYICTHINVHLSLCFSTMLFYLSASNARSQIELNWIEEEKTKRFFSIKTLLIRAHSVLYNWLINARSEENVANWVKRKRGKEGKNIFAVTFSKQITNRHLPACTTARKLHFKSYLYLNNMMLRAWLKNSNSYIIIKCFSKCSKYFRAEFKKEDFI